MKKIKAAQVQKWTFEDERQQFMARMARMRIGTEAISKRTGFSHSQITYGLNRYKVSAGMKVTLRQRWGAGNDPLIDELLQDRSMIAAMEVEIDRKVIPKIKHPTPKVVRIKD